MFVWPALIIVLGVVVDSMSCGAVAFATPVAPWVETALRPARSAASAWDQENYAGTFLDLHRCGEVVPFSNVRSVVNNQYRGTVASFYGPGPKSQRDFQFASAAVEERSTKDGISPAGVGPATVIKAF